MDDNNKRLYYYSNLHNFYLTIIKQCQNDDKIKIRLLSNYKDIEYILEMNKPEDIKFLFFNKTLIHGILYDSEHIIRIQFDIEEKKSFYYNFYLVLLILDQKYINNYEYSIDYIREINNGYKNIKSEYMFILMSKIIIELINYYRQGNKYDEFKEEKELLKIENECINRINRNKNLFSSKEIIKNNIDNIFLGILKYLIVNKEFENDELMNILELEKIEFDDIMINELLIIIKNEQYINNYKIDNIKDFSKIDNINFYYFILKYIFKNSIYIYQIQFLLKTKQNFIKLLHSDITYLQNLLFLYENEYVKTKINFIFIKLFDSEYYSNIYK